MKTFSATTLGLLLQSIGLALIGTILLTTPGCDQASSTYTAEGTIVNSTDRGVANADVVFIQGRSAAKTTTTNDSGYYEVSGLNGGDYDVSINAPGYGETSFSVSVNSDTTIPDEVLLGSASVTGTVADAVDGSAVSNAEVAFTFTFGGEDADTSRSEADFITTTNSSGEYNIQDVPTGEYVCVIRAPGFVPAVIPGIEFEEGTNNLGQMSTSERLEEGEVRIVLEWGKNPSDLDSHLTGPTGDGNRFHVYYANQSPSGADASLDVDDETSFGPETITITEARSGTYRYSVFNFTDKSDDGAVGIDESPARVTVYDENGQRATYSPPAASAGDGNTWRVFELEGSSLSIDDNNGDTFGYYDASGSSDISTFVRTGKSGSKEYTPKEERILRKLFDKPSSAF